MIYQFVVAGIVSGKSTSRWEALAMAVVVLLAFSSSACVSSMGLIIAAKKNDETMLRREINRGAYVNVQSSETGKTPLMIAADRGNSEMVAILLRNDADPNVRGKDGCTALYNATYIYGARSEKKVAERNKIAISLIERGADVGAKCLDGMSPLHNASANGLADVVKALLGKGADPNSRAAAQVTPLHLASERGYADIARSLVEKGADVNAKTSFSVTPLHNASQGGNKELVAFLLQKGARTDVRVTSGPLAGQTAASLADMNGQTEIVALLKMDARQIAAVTAPVRPAAKAAPAEKAASPSGTAVEPAQPGKTAVASAPAAPAAIASSPPVVEPAQPSKTSVALAPAAPAPPAIIPPAAARAPSVSGRGPKNNNYAVVIGIEKYRQRLPHADYAANDALSVAKYLVNTAGYPEDNVVVLTNENATKSDFEKYFERWLGNNVEQNSSVFVYYSGHGAPEPVKGDAYIVPYDGDPTFIEQTGYSLKRLYEALGKLPAKEIVVALDSCFSGVGGKSVLAKGARPLVMVAQATSVIASNTFVMTSAASNQISTSYDDKQHGVFTYFLLEGLAGGADANNDGSISISEMHDFVRPQVERIARKKNNASQTPELIAPGGSADKVFLLSGGK